MTQTTQNIFAKNASPMAYMMLCGKVVFGGTAPSTYFRDDVHASGNGGVVRRAVSIQRFGRTL